MANKPTFPWQADLGAERSVKATVTPVKFGDGYELRQANGINFTPKKWSVSFTTPGEMAKQILAFLEARGGLEAFVWQDPMDDTATYVCREWTSSRQSNSGIVKVSGVFEQVYEY